MREERYCIPKGPVKVLKVEDNPILPGSLPLPRKGEVFQGLQRNTGVVQPADLLRELSNQYPDHKVTV